MAGSTIINTPSSSPSSATRSNGFKLADILLSTILYINTIFLLAINIVFCLAWTKEPALWIIRPLLIWIGSYLAFLPFLHLYLHFLHPQYQLQPVGSPHDSASMHRPLFELVLQMLVAPCLCLLALPPPISPLSRSRLVTPTGMTWWMIWELQKWSFSDWRAQARKATELGVESSDGTGGGGKRSDDASLGKETDEQDYTATQVNLFNRLDQLLSLNVFIGVGLCYLDLPFFLFGRHHWLDYGPLRWNLFALALPSFLLPIVVDRYLRRYHASTFLNLHPLARLSSPQLIRVFALVNLTFVCFMPEVLECEKERASVKVASITFVGYMLCVAIGYWEESIYHGWEEAREEALEEERLSRVGDVSGSVDGQLAERRGRYQKGIERDGTEQSLEADEKVALLA